MPIRPRFVPNSVAEVFTSPAPLQPRDAPEVGGCVPGRGRRCHLGEMREVPLLAARPRRVSPTHPDPRTGCGHTGGAEPSTTCPPRSLTPGCAPRKTWAPRAPGITFAGLPGSLSEMRGPGRPAKVMGRVGSLAVGGVGGGQWGLGGGCPGVGSSPARFRPKVGRKF